MSNNTLQFYQKNASTYVTNRNRPDPRLLPFLERCKVGGRILELGTGSGIDGEAILKAGFQLDATDGSSELAAIASRRLGQDVRVMLFTELDVVGAFDGVYACASLTHAERKDLPDIFKRIYRALVTGGTVWASFKSGTSDGADSFGRYYNYISAEELDGHVKQAGPWSSIDFERWEGTGYDKQPVKWVGVMARKCV